MVGNIQLTSNLFEMLRYLLENMSKIDNEDVISKKTNDIYDMFSIMKCLDYDKDSFSALVNVIDNYDISMLLDGKTILTCKSVRISDFAIDHSYDPDLIRILSNNKIINLILGLQSNRSGSIIGPGEILIALLVKGACLSSGKENDIFIEDKPIEIKYNNDSNFRVANAKKIDPQYKIDFGILRQLIELKSKDDNLFVQCIKNYFARHLSEYIFYIDKFSRSAKDMKCLIVNTQTPEIAALNFKELLDSNKIDYKFVDVRGSVRLLIKVLDFN